MRKTKSISVVSECFVLNRKRSENEFDLQSLRLFTNQLLPTLPGISMADALSLIPAAVLRNLADKLYEKRKNAALEVSTLPRFVSWFSICSILDFCFVFGNLGLLLMMGLCVLVCRLRG